MSTTVNGTIDNPTPNTSHTEPASPVSLGTLQPGTSYNKQIGVYSNTGNVDQTVKVDATTIQNATGITYQGTQWADGSGGANLTQPSITLQPGQSATLFLQFTTANNGPGPDTSVTFDIVPVWS